MAQRYQTSRYSNPLKCSTNNAYTTCTVNYGNSPYSTDFKHCINIQSLVKVYYEKSP